MVSKTFNIIIIIIIIIIITISFTGRGSEELTSWRGSRPSVRLRD